MPERQSSTGEETGRPTTGSVGTGGAGTDHDRAAGAADGSAPTGPGGATGGDRVVGGSDGAALPASAAGGAPAGRGPAVAGAGSGATSASADGVRGTGDGGAVGADGSPADGGTANGAADGRANGTADGTGTGDGAGTTGGTTAGSTAGGGPDGAAAGDARSGGSASTGAGATAAASGGTGANGSGDRADSSPSSSAGTSAPATGPGTGAADGAATSGTTTGGAAAGTPTGTPTGTATGSEGTPPSHAGPSGTASSGTAPTGAGGGTGGTTGGAADDTATPAQGSAADDAATTARTSLFEPAHRPAGARPSAAAATAGARGATPAGDGATPAGGGADDVTSTVAIPGRPAPGAGDPPAPPTGDETVRVALPTASADEPPTRPTPARGGAAETRAVPASTSDAETTQVIPLSRVAPHPSTPPAPFDPPTQRLEVQPTAAPQRHPAAPGGGAGGGAGEPGRSRRRRPLLLVAALLGLLALLYVADLLASTGSVPRGTTVAGVDVGGLSLADAERELRAAVEPRATRPVPVTAGTVTSEIDPVAAGLAVDWDGTLAQAGDQPLNPITRITSFFTTSNELGVVTTADDQALGTAIQQLAPVVDRAPVEGTVRFENAAPVPVDPVPGQQLDPAAAVDVVKAEWASGRPVALPLTPLPARTSAEDVATAVEDVAAPAVSGPVTVLGEDDTEGVLEPETIAEALSFEPGEAGGLVPVLNPTVITDALEDQLDSSEQEPRDAELDFSTTPPTVVPSRDGRGVDYEATLAALLPALTEQDGPREITAVYADQPAELTTEDLGTLGNAGEISRFTTRGFAEDSGVNIRRAAELVDGTIVGPGETFSLDEVTGPRTAANGYVEAGVIENGRAGRGIAGGVSQVSTTTYNAAYFAGMTDVEHRPHSFYISRYPEGREATIVTGALDMRFRNDTPTAVLIRTFWTPSDITVVFYGTKYFEVSSETSPRRDFTEPNTVVVPEDEQCTPSQGSEGFTVTDTRTLRNLQTGEVTTERQTTQYNPAPRVVCGDDEDD